MMNEVTREMTRTPKEALGDPTYVWHQREPWVREDETPHFDNHVAMCILTALAGVPPDGESTPQADEDEVVFLLNRPDLTELVWKSGYANDAVRARVAQAVAQCIKRTRDRWVETYGSLEAEGQDAQGIAP